VNSIDFLPTSYHDERAHRNIAHRRWVLILLTGLTLAGWGGARHKQSADLAWRANSLDSQALVTQQKRSEMDKLREERKALQYQQNIQQQLDQPVAVTQTVAVIGRLMPDSIALTQVSVSAHRPPPKPLEAPNENKRKQSPKHKKAVDLEKQRDYLSIEVHGLAPDDVTVTNLVNTMSDHPLFEKVIMHFSRVDERGDLITRRFRIGAEIPLDRQYQPLLSTAGVTDEN
jgi:hypothetical protein